MKYFKPAIILNKFSVNSGKPVILGDFLQRKGDFYNSNAIVSTFTPWKWIVTKVLNQYHLALCWSEHKMFFLMTPPEVYS